MFTKKGAIVKIILEILSHREKLSINLQVTQSLICSFDETKNRHKFYRRKDRIKRFCNDLKELATEIMNYVKLLFMKAKKYVIYEKKSFVMIKIRKANMPFIIKSEIIAITPRNLEELLILAI